MMLAITKRAERDFVNSVPMGAAQEVSAWWVRWYKLVPPSQLGDILTRFFGQGLLLEDCPEIEDDEVCSPKQ